MHFFNNDELANLKKYLYYSYIHDSKVQSVDYDAETRILKISSFNPIYNVKIDFIFKDVKINLLINCIGFGKRKTILSLTVEEDFSYLKEFTSICGDYLNDSIYMVFQMFSGDEWHIVSKSVSIESEECISLS